MVVAQQPRRWTREEYDRRIESGILGPEDDTVSPRVRPEAILLAADLLP